ncbi:MAG: TIGR01459 family HAD-type hydrolase [Rhodospirillaceae bacterium]|nr:TIGR01459 family HAD-type hydrolase [Rhodospirillaceae bacterium]
MNTREISSLSIISNLYEIFIFDLWGTIYNGKALFPGIRLLLENLKARQKTIIFLSNSPQLPNVVAQRLSRLGLSTLHYDLLVTSGGEANEQLLSGISPVISSFNGLVFELGPNRFPNALPINKFTTTESIAEANWIFNAGPDKESNRLGDYKNLLMGAKQRDLPMLCTNPDKLVFHGEERQLCAGGIAEFYESIGGNVSYIGKPYPTVFEKCLEFTDNFDKKKVIMIGDNLETDIIGADSIGIDSVLIASGVHQLSDSIKNSISSNRLLNLEKKFGTKATFVMTWLAW